jgi:hypothetical protein
MKCTILFLLGWLFLQDVPLKPVEQVELKLEYTVQQRQAPPVTQVNLDRSKKQPATGLLPHVVVILKFLVLTDTEKRIRIVSNDDDQVLQRKIKSGDLLKLELGFTDDMKDRVTAHQYTLLFLDDSKNPQSKIILEVGEDGLFTVNGVTRGKF